MAAELTPEQTQDMLGDLAAGNVGDVFSQEELQRFYDRANGDYNVAVYYGWRQIAANSVKWVDYRVAQTQVSRSQAFDHIKDMLELWGNESKAVNQVKIMGAVPVPTTHKPKPADQYPRPRQRRYPYA